MFIEVISCLVTFIVLYALIQKISRISDIPGPLPYPLVGNLLQLSSKPYVEFSKWRKLYGDIFKVYMGPQEAVFVSSIELTREALVKKSKDFAGRPSPQFLSGIVVPDSGISFADFSPRLTRRRKLVHTALRTFTSRKEVLEQSMKEQLDYLHARFDELAGKDFDPSKHIFFSLNSIIFKMLFGKSYDWDDPEFAKYLEALDVVLESISPTHLLNTLPILRFLPGSGYKKALEAAKIRYDNTARAIEEHKDSFDSQNIRDITDAFLKAKMEEEELTTENESFSEENILRILNELVVGGTDTSSNTILWTMIYLLRNPEIQDNIHHELDTVIGRERCPGIMDRHQLPYLEATITESLRLSSVAPIGVPRTTTCDTSLGQYRLRKGITVIFNNWEMHHDPNCWENPDEYKPERFIDEHGRFQDPSSTKSWIPFGAGRRVCPGELLGKETLSYFLSNLLHRYKFENPVGQILPDQIHGIYNGIIHLPKPFKIHINKRMKND